MSVEFQPDYIITWDFAEGSEYPHIRIARMHADKEVMHLICDVIGTSEEKSGIVSLRQLLDEHDALERVRDIKCPCGMRDHMDEEDCIATECADCCPLAGGDAE